MKVSSVRVITTRYLPAFSTRSRSASPNPNTRFFSLSPPAWVPLSTPPWPGSITTTGRGSGGSVGLDAITPAGSEAGGAAAMVRRQRGGRWLGNGRPEFGPDLGRARSGGPVSLFQFDDEPRRLAVGRIQHI